MEFIINTENFILNDKNYVDIKCTKPNESRNKTIIDFIQPNKEYKHNKIELNPQSTSSNFSDLIVNLNIKDDNQYIKNVYCNILSSNIKYLSILLYISNIYTILINKKDNSCNKILRIINKIKKIYSSFNIDLYNSDCDIYRLHKYIENRNIFFYSKYLELSKRKDETFEKLKNIKTYKDVYLPFRYVCKKDLVNMYNIVRDNNKTLYSKLSHNQPFDFSYHQTICQPLIVNSQNVCSLSNNIETLDNNKYIEITLHNPEKKKDYRVVNSNIDPSNKDTANYTNNIFLPKFLKTNSVPYHSSLEKYLEQKHLDSKEFTKKYKNVITKEGIWNSPEPISGNLDVDTLIKELKKRLPTIKQAIVDNYKVIKKCNYNDNMEGGLLNTLLDLCSESYSELNCEMHNGIKNSIKCFFINKIKINDNKPEIYDPIKYNFNNKIISVEG